MCYASTRKDTISDSFSVDFRADHSSKGKASDSILLKGDSASVTLQLFVKLSSEENAFCRKSNVFKCVKSLFETNVDILQSVLQIHV